MLVLDNLFTSIGYCLQGIISDGGSGVIYHAKRKNDSYAVKSAKS